MKTKTCPMCQGTKFYFVWTGGVAAISLGFLKSVLVYSAICLECGSVTSSVDAGGLAAIREKAKSEGIEIGEKPIKQELPEV